MGGVLGDNDLIYRIRCIGVVIGAGVGICLTIELYAFIIAYRERLIDFYGYVESVDAVASVSRLVYTLISAAVSNHGVTPLNLFARF